MTTLSTQPYKGTRDFYPEDMRFRQWTFQKMRQVCESYGYLEYDGPTLEAFELYAAKTGEEIVNQQLYSLVDRGDRKVAMRPEMTPTLARMVAQKFHELPKPIRWYSIPNCWRYERPQRGRLREFFQLNVDLLGGDPILADAEILSVATDLVRAFGGRGKIAVLVNNRRLMDHFFTQELKLSADGALKVTKAIDARAKIGEEKYAQWMSEIGVDAAGMQKIDRFFKSSFAEVAKSFPCPGTQELEALFRNLRESGFGEDEVRFEPTVLRGLDYYTGTVFELFDISPENRRAMFGGGRYDNLLNMFGNYHLPGVGFGMGDVTLRNFLEVHGLMPTFGNSIDAFITLPKSELHRTVDQLSRKLRESGIKVATALEASGFGAQLKQASKLGARYAVILGEAELARQAVMLKNLGTGEQREVAQADLVSAIRG
jgi:histidyl-tRNA synthetase